MERRVSRRLALHLFLLCCCSLRLIDSSPDADLIAQPSQASHYGHRDYNGQRQSSNNVNWMEFSPPGSNRQGRQQEWPSRPTRPPPISNWPSHEFQQPSQQPRLHPDIFHFDFDVPWENNPARQNRHEFSQYQQPSPPVRKPVQLPTTNPLQGPVPIRVANPDSFNRNPTKKGTPVVTDLEILTNEQPLRSSEVDSSSSEGLFGHSVTQSFPFKVPEPSSTVKTTDSQEGLLVEESEEETEEEDAEVESEIAVLVSSTVPSVWKLFPLLPPPTPPGKQIIGDFRKTNSQVPDTHRQSASLSAASAFAKSRPHLRERIRGAYRQEPTEKPRPYRRRPIRPTTTTTTTTEAPPELSEEVPEVPEEDFGVKAVKETVRVMENEPRNIPPREEMKYFDEKEEGEEEEKQEQLDRDNEYEYDVKEEVKEQEGKKERKEEELKEVDDNNNEEEEDDEEFFEAKDLYTSTATPPSTTTTMPTSTTTGRTTTITPFTTTPMPSTTTSTTTSTTSTTTTPSTITTPSSSTTSTTSTTTTTTTETTTTAASTPSPRYSTKPSAAAKPSPEDIKSLLRSSESLSLSEILQRKGMSLADLLKGGPSLVQQVKASKETSPEPQETSTTSTTTTTTTTTSAPVETKELSIGSIPQVKPVKLTDLLSSKNITLTDIIKPKDPPKDLLPLNITSLFRSVYKPPAKPQSTFKPEVKRPAPFRPGTGKGLPNVPAFQTSQDDPEPRGNDQDSGEQEDIRSPKELPSQPDWSNLKPLVFGGKAAVSDTTTSTTTSTATSTAAEATTTKSEKLITKSRRPYVAPNSVGEYGVYAAGDDDEDGNNTDSVLQRIVPFGGNRPIATSRLTPAPPKRQRPISVASDWLEEDRSYPEETIKDVNMVPSSHFNEEELIEESTFDDLPISVKSAIIASSAIGGFCLVVFVGILVAFRLRQKTRVRLRHPAAIFGAGMAGSAVTGSDSSGVTTPVTSPKGGYAKLPYRSSGLWGTLRRTLRQMDSH